MTKTIVQVCEDSASELVGVERVTYSADTTSLDTKDAESRSNSMNEHDVEICYHQHVNDLESLHHVVDENSKRTDSAVKYSQNCSEAPTTRPVINKRVSFKLNPTGRLENGDQTPVNKISMSRVMNEISSQKQTLISNKNRQKVDMISKKSFLVFLCLLLNQILATFLLTTLASAIVTIVIGLASFGASFGLRKMYVKALLKIFEYATNIKQQKVKDCEELLDREITNPQEKDKALDKIKMLRLQSFMLKPPEKLLKKPTMVDDGERRVTTNQSTRESSNENATTSRQRSALDDIDMQNNNYLSSQKTQSSNDDQADRHKTPALLHKTESDNDLIKNIHKRDFELGDVISFVNKGLEAIIDDEVTKRFTTEELTVWNLLSRTNQQYEYVSFRVTVLWLLGLLFRYCVLFPFRLLLFILACFFTFLSTFLIGHVKDGPFKRSLNWYSSLVLHRMLSRVFSAIITFHNREHRAKPGSICVANHTSPIDVIILSTDNCYSMIGQEHGGFTGMMQRAFSRASKHIWFDRSESKDRHLVAKRMRDHVADANNMPILIFPEGTCINNTSVMMFKKGCFEVDTTIAPVAIKYDPRFGDAFWNSSKHSMLQYLMLMMTSWAIVVDVFYLPPMTRREDEDAAMFASRVKSVIAKKGGFVDLNWDGMLKRQTPKLDLMYEQQQKYVSQLKVDLNKQS